MSYRPIRTQRRVPVVLLVLSLGLAGGAAVAGPPNSAAAASAASAPGLAATGKSTRPYAADSPWNTPIGAAAKTHPRSAQYIERLTERAGPLTSDPTQYTFPVFEVSNATPLRPVTIANTFSTYNQDGTRRGNGQRPTMRIPVPPQAMGSGGSDQNIVIHNVDTGQEWGLFRFERGGNGTYRAAYGYVYNTRWSGRFGDGLAGRGSGLPYLGGLIRADELSAGRIDHALAFTYRYPSRQYVYPASRSDGKGVAGVDLPEGTRLQLNPRLTEADFDRFGLSPEARTVARAMQRYGMYLVDNGGSAKVLFEDDTTANWGGTVRPGMLRGIPWSEFRVVS